MIILDENIPASQRQNLNNWRIRVRQVGYNIGRPGMQDQEIIAFLHQLRRLTFFTRDSDFYARELCHRRYCLVYLAVERDELAHFVRRVIRQIGFDNQTKRMGSVLRVSSAGLSVWRLQSQSEQSVAWG